MKSKKKNTGNELREGYIDIMMDLRAGKITPVEARKRSKPLDIKLKAYKAEMRALTSLSRMRSTRGKLRDIYMRMQAGKSMRVADRRTLGIK